MKLLIVLNDVLRSLDELNQNSFSTKRVGILALRVDESHIVTSSTLTNTARSETHSLLLKILDAGRKVINPETNVVQWGHIHLRALGRIIRLHDVHFDGHGSLSATKDILLHVLLGRLQLNTRLQKNLKGVNLFQTKDVDPEILEGCLAGSTDSNLLNTKYSVGLGGSESALLECQ